VSIAEAHGARKNHAEHRSASGVLLYFAAVLRTPDHKGPREAESGDHGLSRRRPARKEATPGRTEHLPHKRRLMKFVKVYGRTSYHRWLSARWGTATSRWSADPRLHDMEGLRVVDASVMPAIVSSNTQAPTVIIGQKPVDLITRRERHSSTQNAAPYRRIGPGRVTHLQWPYKPPRHECPKESGVTQ
jgi:choline dehydrogenase-like flavoprotein